MRACRLLPDFPGGRRLARRLRKALALNHCFGGFFLSGELLKMQGGLFAGNDGDASVFIFDKFHTITCLESEVLADLGRKRDAAVEGDHCAGHLEPLDPILTGWASLAVEEMPHAGNKVHEISHISALREAARLAGDASRIRDGLPPGDEGLRTGGSAKRRDAWVYSRRKP